MKSNKVKEISLIGILAAVNIASRIYLQALPNIKPVTSIIIISVMLFGLAFGVKLSVVTTVVSNLFLGMGTWTFFQILAWVVICLITQSLMDFLKKIGKEPKLFPMAILFYGICLWYCCFSRTINVRWTIFIYCLLYGWIVIRYIPCCR